MEEPVDIELEKHRAFEQVTDSVRRMLKKYNISGAYYHPLDDEVILITNAGDRFTLKITEHTKPLIRHY